MVFNGSEPVREDLFEHGTGRPLLAGANRSEERG
jgi:hypothetical protein